MDVSIRLLSERLGRLLAGEEGTLPDAAKQHIQNLQSEIEIVTSLLRGYEVDMNWLLIQLVGEEKQIDSPDLLDILKEISRFVFDSEKVIDTFVVSTMQQESGSGCISKDFCDALLGLQGKIIDIKQWMLRVQHISTDLIDEFKSFQTQANHFHFSSSSSAFEDKMEELLDVLIDGRPQLSVVAVIDSSGFEKIPYNGEAYSSNYVKNYFDCRARLFFNFNPQDMLDDLMKSLMPPSDLSEVMDKAYQQKKIALRDYLRNKRYLIVLDGLSANYVWNEIKEALPDDQNGSRVLTTVTFAETLQYFKIEEGQIFLPSTLAPGRGPLTVTDDGIQFVYLYYGRKSLGEDMKDMFHVPTFSLLLSILELPLYLKLCLFYFSTFGRFEISTRQLYELWMAEGFIPDNSKATAELYLEQLISRGFIQVKKRRPTGTIKVCTFPSTTMVALRTMVHKIGFVDILGYETTNLPGLELINVLGPNLSEKISKRLIFHVDNLSRFDLLKHSNAYLLSLLHPASSSNNLAHIDWDKIFKNFKHIRILNMGSLVLNQFPSGIENLLLLRYLKLNIPSLKSLPSSICNLPNLCTLDMSSSYIDHTPDDFWKMNKLRHLNCIYIILPAHPRNYCSSLENLNSISALHVKSCTPDMLGKLPNLQSLGIYGDLSYYQSVLSKSLCKLSCLESLKLVNESKMTQLSQVVPSTFQCPQTLTHLSFSNTKLKDDPMPILERLPHLQTLKLKQNSYIGRKLACGPDRFPSLKVLHLKSMLWLEEWTMGFGSMPKLESLVINPCAYLRKLPEELWRVKTLCKMELRWPQPELRQRLQEFEDTDRYGIQIYPYGL